MSLSCDEWMPRLGIDLTDEEARDRVEMLYRDIARTCSAHTAVTVTATRDERPQRTSFWPSTSCRFRAVPVTGLDRCSQNGDRSP